LRDANLCGLQWSWEVFVPEIGRSVFVVPEDEFKAKRPHVVILNDVAWSVIQTQRGRHPVWVFPYRGRRVARMNNSAWRQARREAGLRAVRVHDLRHTYACRLRAAGVSAEDRTALLGHATQSMVGHYASGRRRPVAARGQPGAQPAGDAHGAARLEWFRNRKTTGGRKIPQRSHSYNEHLVLLAKCLISGAAGRIRTHDPLVRR